MKGVSFATIGLIIGISPLTVAVLSPFYGRIVRKAEDACMCLCDIRQSKSSCLFICVGTSSRLDCINIYWLAFNRGCKLIFGVSFPPTHFS